MSEDNDSETIKKRYHCKICNETHTIELKKDLTEGRTKYPFPYVYLHSTVINGNEPKEVLSILYIDRSFQIRAAEVQEFDENHLFSKDQVIAITVSNQQGRKT